MDTSHAGIAALLRAQERWNHDDLAGYLRLYAPDAVLHGYAGVGPGIADIRAFYEGFIGAFPGCRLRFDDLFASGDKITCRFALSGRHGGPFQGLPPTGRDFSVPGITILRMSGDRCVERWNQADFLSLMQQLGAIPSGA